MLKHILVPVDGSEGSNHAARFAAGLAADASAKLTVLYVADLGSAQAIGLAGVSADEFDSRLRGLAQPAFDRTAEAMGAFAVPIRLVEKVVLGHAADEIIAMAAAETCDLIVMGSRGLSPMPQLLLGSVSEKVLRRAHCPVTIVR